MKRKSWLILASVAVMGGVGPALAQNEAKPVEAAELVRSPQKYWARSFVFADVLRMHPSGGQLKIEGRRYIPFSTEEAGKCYVEVELAHVIEALPLERRYHFMGTVLQYDRRYFIMVRGVSAAVEQGDLKLNWPEIGASPADHMKNQALRPILDILTLAESAQVAYAEEKGVELSELYDPQSPHYGQAMGLMRSTLMAQEQKAKLPSSEMLTEYLFQILVARHPPGKKSKPAPEKPAPEAVPAGTEKPVAEESPAVTEAPAVEPAPAMEEPPKRLTWGERRELARRKKAEARAEKERLEAQAPIPEEPGSLPAAAENPPSAPAMESPAVVPEATPGIEIKPPDEEPAATVTREQRKELARQQKARAAEEKKRRAAEREAPAPKEEPAVETPVIAEAPAADEPAAEEPPKRLTWRERRELARQKKAAELVEFPPAEPPPQVPVTDKPKAGSSPGSSRRPIADEFEPVAP